MEAAFGEIRKMISKNKLESEISLKVQWLKRELDGVLPVLEKGHKLAGEQAHDAYDNQQVVVQWQEALKEIEDLLADAIGLYREGKFQESSEKVQQAHYDGFKNTELEISVRRYRSQEKAGAIDGKFYALIKLTSQPAQLTLPITHPRNGSPSTRDSFKVGGTSCAKRLSRGRKNSEWFQPTPS